MTTTESPTSTPTPTTTPTTAVNLPSPYGSCPFDPPPAYVAAAREELSPVPRCPTGLRPGS